MGCFDLARSYEYTVSLSTGKVPDSLDRAIVLAIGVVELDSQPFSLFEGGSADEPDDSTTLWNRHNGPKW